MAITTPPYWMYRFPSSDLIDAVGNNIYPLDYRQLAAGLVLGRLASIVYNHNDILGWIAEWSGRSMEFAVLMQNATPIPPYVYHTP